MKLRLHLLVISGIAWVVTAGFLGMTPAALAQSSSGSSRSDGESRERGRFGERGRGDWRSGRSRRDEEHRGDERRSEERSSSSGSSSTGSGSTSSSARSTNSSAPAPGATASTTASSSSANLGLEKWAAAVVAKNDKNGDKILQPDEQKGLGSSAGADLNHDGMITIDELVMHHSPGAAAAAPAASAASPSTSSTSDSGRSSDRDRSRGGSYGDSRSKTDDAMAKRVLTGTAGGTSKDADKRHSYRFSRATDKLPTGLPSWFTSRDGNKDGQVSMSEYSRTMSQGVVTEFRRYDKNDDGLITAKEAAKK